MPPPKTALARFAVDVLASTTGIALYNGGKSAYHAVYVRPAAAAAVPLKETTAREMAQMSLYDAVVDGGAASRGSGAGSTV